MRGDKKYLLALASCSGVYRITERGAPGNGINREHQDEGEPYRFFQKTALHDAPLAAT